VEPRVLNDELDDFHPSKIGGFEWTTDTRFLPPPGAADRFERERRSIAHRHGRFTT